MFSFYTIKVILFLLFGFKEIISTPAVYLENDITKLLDYWIEDLFAIDVESPYELIATINDHILKEIQLEPAALNPVFHNLSFHAEQESQSEEWEYPQLFWKFSEDELRVYCKEIRIRVRGIMYRSFENKITSFNTFIGIENFTFIAKIDNASKCPEKFDTAYDFSNSAYWHWLTEDVDTIFTNETLSTRDIRETARRLLPALPELFHEHIKDNPKFAHSLNQIFQSFTQSRVPLISDYPNFLTNPQLYHYLIPKFPLLSFELKRIVISGLSNFDSFKVHKMSPFFTHALLIKNLRGSMVLDYKFENETFLELQFQIDSLFVMKKDEVDCINVQAKYYSVTQANITKPLSGRQQEVLMNGLEAAIASSIMPFTKIGRVCDLDTSLEKIQISNKSNWDVIKKSYKGWIPFNDD